MTCPSINHPLFKYAVIAAGSLYCISTQAAKLHHLEQNALPTYKAQTNDAHKSHSRKPSVVNFSHKKLHNLSIGQPQLFTLTATAEQDIKELALDINGLGSVSLLSTPNLVFNDIKKGDAIDIPLTITATTNGNGYINVTSHYLRAKQNTQPFSSSYSIWAPVGSKNNAIEQAKADIAAKRKASSIIIENPLP